MFNVQCSLLVLSSFIPTYIRHRYFHIHIFIHSPFGQVFVYIVIFFGIARLFPCCGKLCIARGNLYIFVFNRIQIYISGVRYFHATFTIEYRPKRLPIQFFYKHPFCDRTLAFCVQKQKKTPLEFSLLQKTKFYHMFIEVLFQSVRTGGISTVADTKTSWCIFVLTIVSLCVFLDILLVHLVFLSCLALIFHARKDSVYTFILFSFFSMLLLYFTSAHAKCVWTRLTPQRQCREQEVIRILCDVASYVLYGKSNKMML